MLKLKIVIVRCHDEQDEKKAIIIIIIIIINLGRVFQDKKHKARENTQHCGWLISVTFVVKTF